MSKSRYFILIVLALTSTVQSSKDKITEDEIEQLETTLYEAVKYMKVEVKDENVAICIGTTRSGKSTLINYLIGNKLKAVRLLWGLPITIEKSDNKSIGPVIGSGSASKTKIPTKWTSNNLPNLSIWDAPGFDDNRGVAQDIINAYYLYELIKNVKSLIIVLVVDINNVLTDDVEPFVSVLKDVENLLGNNMKDYFRSITVIFTKVPDTLNGFPVDMKLIGNILSYKFLSDNKMNLSQITKDFIKFLVENNDRFGFFKRPEIGLLTSAVDVNIFSSINNSTSLPKDQIQTLKPSISDSSKISLFEIRRTYSLKTFQDLGDAIRTILDQKVSDLYILGEAIEAETNIRIIKYDLTAIQETLYNVTFNAQNSSQIIENLCGLGHTITKEVKEHKLLEKIKLMEFVDKLLDLKEDSKLDFGLPGILKFSISKVKESINYAQTKLNSISCQRNEIRRMEEFLRLKEEIAKLNEKVLSLTPKPKNEGSLWWRPVFIG